MIQINIKDLDTSYIIGNDRDIEKEIIEILKSLYRKEKNTFNKEIALGKMSKIFIETINKVDQEEKDENKKIKWDISLEEKLAYSD